MYLVTNLVQCKASKLASHKLSKILKLLRNAGKEDFQLIGRPVGESWTSETMDMVTSIGGEQGTEDEDEAEETSVGPLFPSSMHMSSRDWERNRAHAMSIHITVAPGTSGGSRQHPLPSPSIPLPFKC